MQKTHQRRLDLVLAELLVFVQVVRNQQLPHTRAHLLGKGVIAKGERPVEVWKGKRRVGVCLIDFLIVLRNVELVSEVALHSEEALNPIKVFVVGDESVVVLVDFGEDLPEDVAAEVVELQEREGTLEQNDELVTVEVPL